MENFFTPELVATLAGFAIVAVAALTALMLRRAKAAAAKSETKLDDYILGVAEELVEKKAQRK